MERAIGAKKGFQMASDEGKIQTTRIDAIHETTILGLFYEHVNGRTHAASGMASLSTRGRADCRPIE